MMLELQLDNNDVCLSGGADGADVLWGYCAGKLGHSVIHWGYQGMKTQAPEQEVVRLSKEHLEVADSYLEDANQTLKRKLNFNSNFINLLRRNYYQICFSSSVYAISTLNNKNIVNGGTSWAIQMFIDRINREELENHNIYLFEQNKREWMKYNVENGEWIILENRPPKPSKIWAGIGSRTISKDDKEEIKEFMGV